jgi:ferredoxin-NADP reductase
MTKLVLDKILAEVVYVKYVTQDIIELETKLIAPDVVHFKAGQFVQFNINGIFRSYSIVNPPSAETNTLLFLIKIIPQGVGSEYVKALKPGDVITMRGPLGILGVKENHWDRPLFFIATGVGIAPFHSVIFDLLSRNFTQEINLVFGVRSEEDTFYYDKFQNLSHLYKNFHFVPILSRPQSHWPGQVGRVTTYLDIHYERHADSTFFVCGSKDMVMDTHKLLVNRGHSGMDIHIEIF